MNKIMNQEEKEIIIKEIVDQEWEMFQKVESLGGRANCQDEWPTFEVMRTSQFQAWNIETLESYRTDLKEALGSGRNLITEKYAYMMEYTAPEYFEVKLKPYLPALGGTRLSLIQRILQQLMAWEKEWTHQYPRVAGRGRPLEASGDTHSATSVETYMMGELKTYSEETLERYYNHIKNTKAAGENLARTIMEYTVGKYGYASLEDAEKRI